MTLRSISSCITAAAMVCTTPAFAQDGSWQTSFTFYLWTAETDVSIATPFGDIDSTLSFSDALENLDFAFMGVMEARNGRWSLLGDFAQTNLSFSKNSPGPVLGGVDADVKLQVLNAYALYETSSNSNWALDMGAGFRSFNTDSTLDVLPGVGTPGRTSSFNQSWIDPVLAARFTYVFNDRWTGSAFLDYGGFRDNSESFQVALTARYAINDDWSFVAGYRYLDITHGPSDNEFKFSQSGPIVGVRYEF
jgi:opacity protein-like surface antigen